MIYTQLGTYSFTTGEVATHLFECLFGKMICLWIYVICDMTYLFVVMFVSSDIGMWDVSDLCQVPTGSHDFRIWLAKLHRSFLSLIMFASWMIVESTPNVYQWAHEDILGWLGFRGVNICINAILDSIQCIMSCKPCNKIDTSTPLKTNPGCHRLSQVWHCCIDGWECRGVHLKKRIIFLNDLSICTV